MSVSVRTEVVVEATPDRAFRVFTEKAENWWPPDHHIGKAPLETVMMERRENGRWYEVGTDGSQCDWGRVLVWDPPRRLVLAWQLTSQWQFDSEFVTEVEVNFTPVDKTRTRVAREHRNLERFGMDEETVRKSIESLDGWPGILKRFAAAAESQQLQQAV
ncbi:MAG: SRPBCC family protein [Acidobacteriota bacterium]|nr:SRPBCC family protein [Acidobacteriota bacterium]